MTMAALSSQSLLSQPLSDIPNLNYDGRSVTRKTKLSNKQKKSRSASKNAKQARKKARK